MTMVMEKVSRKSEARDKEENNVEHNQDHKERNVRNICEADIADWQMPSVQEKEALLFEYPYSGASGVDLPALKRTGVCTGLPVRESIGLPEVTEPEAIRHFVRLSRLNFSIVSHFYPLGSCTMKHNPRINEKVARLKGFAMAHPLQHEDQVQGALEVIYTVGEWLKALSGLPGVTLNPAAGAHGELAGLMVIRRAHEAKGNPRKKVLIPDSAHGTNPATAAMCGYETVTLPSTKEGTLDIQALENALDEDVAAIMLTNPNTCGKFEPQVLEIARLVHQVGAYFYCDGANFNAIVGRIRPGDFGVDVMHFNLHKTFSTPHGGGGPGAGPIAVSKELEPYLPVPRVLKQGKRYILDTEQKESFGRLRAFQGQFGMAVRALAYMFSHGADGLKQVAEDAVLNANYILSQLQDLYHVPYPGYCMHECLLTDALQKSAGVTTIDIAKTLIDHGIHPMTVYFPLVVQGSMLIEPTETEPKVTIDRFIEVMRGIAGTVKQEGASGFAGHPLRAPIGRPDEVMAARKPVLVFPQ